jgi:hypothetical protein
VFTVRNEGDAPLKVVQGPTTCACTISNVDNDAIAPGKSAEITLTWEPKGGAEEFEKSAEIWTNDPENPTITLKIIGMVAPKLTVLPPDRWELKDFREDGVSEFEGLVASPLLDSFNIVALESGSPLMTAEATEVSRRQVAEVRGMSGYKVRVKVKAEMPVGSFAFPLKIKTDIPSKKVEGRFEELNVLVVGARQGPIRLLGREWVEEKVAFVLPTFSAREGKKFSVRMFVRKPPPDGFRILESTSDPEFLKFIVVPDESAKKADNRRYLLTIEFPPGTPRMTRREEEGPATVKLKTNHPEAAELEYQVYFGTY